MKVTGWDQYGGGRRSLIVVPDGPVPVPSMTPITEQELVVIERLMIEAEDAEQEIGRVLGPDDKVVVAIRNARDFLRGMRDAGQWCAFALPHDHPESADRARALEEP